jgi:hypothetical protein
MRLRCLVLAALLAAAAAPRAAGLHTPESEVHSAEDLRRLLEDPAYHTVHMMEDVKITEEVRRDRAGGRAGRIGWRHASTMPSPSHQPLTPPSRAGLSRGPGGDARPQRHDTRRPVAERRAPSPRLQLHAGGCFCRACPPHPAAPRRCRLTLAAPLALPTQGRIRLLPHVRLAISQLVARNQRLRPGLSVDMILHSPGGRGAGSSRPGGLLLLKLHPRLQPSKPRLRTACFRWGRRPPGGVGCRCRVPSASDPCPPLPPARRGRVPLQQHHRLAARLLAGGPGGVGQGAAGGRVPRAPAREVAAGGAVLRERRHAPERTSPCFGSAV